MNSLLIMMMLTLFCVSTINVTECDDTDVIIYEEQPELAEIHATIYCSGTTTADGSKVREGICAVAPKHIGETALIYTLDKELIGIFECKDTGGTPIKNGNVVDVYFSTEERGREFIFKTYENNRHGKVLIQYIDAEG